MNFIIGSGPNGVAAAYALLSQDQPVTMIDVGVEIDAQVQAQVRKLSSLPPDKLLKQDLSKFKSQYVENSSGFPLKSIFGSDFAYATKEMAKLHQHGTQCLQSEAKGGLSNVWGAAVLPYTENDFKDWPIKLKDLVPYYKEVASFLPIAGRKDELENDFPFYQPPLAAVDLSKQAQYLLQNLSSSLEKLQHSGFSFGASRLAIQKNLCQNIGLCLTGCPYEAIYNSKNSVEELKKNPKFTYKAGFKLLSIEENNEQTLLYCEEVSSKSKITFNANRVFLALGAISTTKVILNSIFGSQSSSEIQLQMQYHPYFLLPMMLLKNFPNVASERLHTLAQIFLEIEDLKISPQRVHLQIYTYNEFFRQRLAAVAKFLPFIERLVLGRLVAIQGYLHSSLSSPVQMKARKSSATDSIELELSGGLNETARTIIKKVQRKLFWNSFKIGAIPLGFMNQYGKPGDGNHIGSIFPMSANPKEWQTDYLGRLNFFKRVHLVDSSVLPNLPATTITYTTMANAYRIGSLTAKMEK